MPARRRFHGSESDDNFSVLIDTGIEYGDSEKSGKYIEDIDSDDKKKNAPVKNFYSGFKVPNSLTKWSSNVGTFIQQQIVQVGNVDVEQLFFENNPPTDNKSPLIENTSETIDNDFDDFEDNSEISVMAARDRTAEFATTIRSLQGRNIARAVNIRDPKKATQLQSYSEFMMIAKHIGRNIASTYSKLEKLTLCE